MSYPHLRLLASEHNQLDPPDVDQPPNNGAARPKPSLTTFELTDTGNSEALVSRHGSNIRYSPREKCWRVWDSRRWPRAERGEADQLVKEMLRAMKAEASVMQERERSEEIWKHAHRSESNQKIRATLERAATEPGISIMPDDLDRDPNLLNVANGTLDLRTYQLREHRREDFITRISPVRYDRSITIPTFLSFLDQIFIGNERLINFMQRVTGYSLTGDTTERCMFVLYGVGKNGKSTFLSLLRELLGEYAVTISADTLLVKKQQGIGNDIARLKGARLVTAVESDEGARMAEGLVKTMTGGEDLLTGRFLYGEHFDFRPQFKLFLATNHKPVIRGTDQAIWDRIKLFPFNYVVPDDQRDPHFMDKLRAELPGILAWAVDGLKAWRDHGLGVPPEVSAATAGYREEMDTLGGFLDECCTIGDGMVAAAGALYDAYKAWCERNSENPATQTRFGLNLSDRGFSSVRNSRSGRKEWMRIGLRAGLNGPEQSEPNFQ